MKLPTPSRSQHFSQGRVNVFESFHWFALGAGVAIVVCTVISKREHDAAMELVDLANNTSERLAERVRELEAERDDADWWKK